MTLPAGGWVSPEGTAGLPLGPQSLKHLRQPRQGRHCISGALSLGAARPEPTVLGAGGVGLGRTRLRDKRAGVTVADRAGVGDGHLE